MAVFDILAGRQSLGKVVGQKLDVLQEGWLSTNAFSNF
jgi:hypothetical protein